MMMRMLILPVEWQLTSEVGRRHRLTVVSGRNGYEGSRRSSSRLLGARQGKKKPRYLFWV